MDTKLLITFIILNAFNVIIQTAKSLVTVKCGKLPAAIANAIAYGLYTVVVIYMVCELPLFWKVLIVGTCNFLGVYLVKFVEEKLQKDKLWKIEATIEKDKFEDVKSALGSLNIPYNYIDINKYFVFNIYSETQKDSTLIKEVLNRYNAKYFVSENKSL